jgi:hypothetical protein
MEDQKYAWVVFSDETYSESKTLQRAILVCSTKDHALHALSYLRPIAKNYNNILQCIQKIDSSFGFPELEYFYREVPVYTEK